MVERALLPDLKRIAKTLEGGGISYSMGNDSIRRFDSETGELYYTSRRAELTTSSAKLQALLDLKERLAEIISVIAQVQP